jgi:RNA polymerase sigma-70 factor (ECF subfamily)
MTTGSHLTALPTLADLYRRHAGDVARWAGRLGGPGADVDDIVQEVFIIVARKLSLFRGEAKPTTWMFRITDHVVRNHRRRMRVRRIVTRLNPWHAAQLEDPIDGPLATLERRAEAERAFRLLDALPEKYRRVLILCELEEMPPAQIADLLETRIETVRVWLHRARRMFVERQRQLEAEEGLMP